MFYINPIFSLFLLVLFCDQIKGQGAFSRAKYYGKYPVNLLEANLDPVDIIQNYGFPLEIHNTITNDGYHLTLYRIPAKGRPPVLLVHPMLASAKEFLLPLTGSVRDSLPMTLYLNKYDTWLFNARGSLYSQGHVNKSSKSSEYWNFSIDEMAIYDIPAAIDHILSATKKHSISYIGWSLGTILFYKSVSAHPELNNKINLFIGYGASSGYLGNITIPIKSTLPIVLKMFNSASFSIVNTFIKGAFPLGLGNLIRFGWPLVCNSARLLCDLAFAVMAGIPTKVIDDTIIVALGKWPSTTSIRTIQHVIQEVTDIKGERIASRYFDFGPSENMRIYRNAKPPVYNLKRITVPIVTFSGITDASVTPRESEWTSKETSSNYIRNIIIGAEGRWCHADFALSPNAPELLYKPTLKYLKEFNP